MNFRPAQKRSNWPLRLVILAVLINGLFLIIVSLSEQFSFLHHHVSFSFRQFLITYRVIAGLSLVYLAWLLSRRKQMALSMTLIVYGLVALLWIVRWPFLTNRHSVTLSLATELLLPVAVVCGLLHYRREFKVQSDISGFRQALVIVAVLLAVTFAYGVSGFLLMDEHDFHKEIGFGSAIVHTVDQLGLTTKRVTAYTDRGRIFVDSLSAVSVAAVAYAALSFAQPLKLRFLDQARKREQMSKLLKSWPADSEDFFKLWPHDKYYYFSPSQNSGLAFKVQHGAALVAGDPAGSPGEVLGLIKSFEEQCYINGWRPALIHTTPRHLKLYEKLDYTVQKIGEEAIVDIEHFQSSVISNKYFRNIVNRFDKAGYTTELFMPPHSTGLKKRFKKISDEWLSRPGRVERGFMMGYFSERYIDQCPIMVARNSSGVIEAFINQVPSFDKEEANFDLLRHTSVSLGNINDYLLINFMDYVGHNAYTRLNMGLSPLAGFHEDNKGGSLLDKTFSFAYKNGDRMYSFSGLHSFKNKYEPSWSPRYIVYRGGIKNFTLTLNALNSAMRVSKAGKN